MALPSTASSTTAEARGACELRVGCLHRTASGTTTAWLSTPTGSKTEPSLRRSAACASWWGLGWPQVATNLHMYLRAKPFWSLGGLATTTLQPSATTRYDYDKLTILTAGVRPRDATDVLHQVCGNARAFAQERRTLLLHRHELGLVSFRRRICCQLDLFVGSKKNGTQRLFRGSAAVKHLCGAF